MSHCRRSTILATLLVAACSASPAPEALPAPSRAVPPGATPPARVELSTGYIGTALLERNDSIVLTLPDGSRQVQRLGRHARFSVEVRPDGQVRVRLDSLALRPSARGGEPDAVGTEWRGRLSPAGLADLKSSRSGTLVADLGTAVAEMFPRLPNGGVAPGDRWADTTEGSLQVEIFETQERRTRAWRAGQRSPRQGVMVQPVRVTERYEQLGAGEQADREMRMSAQGSRSATYYLTMTGLVDAMVEVDSAARLITIPSTRQAVPTVQVTRTTVMFSYP
jgi:hypothetical protein